MVSFDVVSRISVSIREAMGLLGRHFEATLRHFRQVLTSSYFTFAGQFYEKTDGVAACSSLTPVITNFLKDIEMTLDRAAHKPLGWFRYVDDICVIWPHGLDRLRNLLNHQNSEFIMERRKETDTFLSYIQIFTGDSMALWTIKYTANLPISTSI
jgi:hypothetical protein